MQDLMAQARTTLRHEPIERRVRARLAGRAVVDSTRAILVWEPRRAVPTYAVPAEDIDAELTPAPAAERGVAGVLHPGIPFSVHTAAGAPLSIEDRAGAGFRLADADLAGYVALDFAAFDEWYEEDQQVFVHPRDPYHRVDVLLTKRPVRIDIGGEVVAETARARVLYETSLPTRFYIPREDVDAELLASERQTHCPFKGRASYWSVEAGGRLRPDIAWSYEQPLPALIEVTGLIAFWDHRVDVIFDGDHRGEPTGAVAAALRDEFRV